MGSNRHYKQLLILLFPVMCFGQTRMYYYGSFSALPYSWTLSSQWNVTTGTNVGAWMIYPRNYMYIPTVSVATTSGQAGATTVRQMLLKPVLTPSLAAQTLNGTINLQVFCRSSVSTSTQQLIVYARLINQNGSVAQEIGNGTSTALSPSASTNINRTISIPLSNVVVTAGQRIAFEEGIYQSTASVTTATGGAGYNFGVILPDAPVDNTSQPANSFNQWIEFSQPLQFQFKQMIF